MNKSTNRVRRWRNNNREHVKEYDRIRKAKDRELYKSIFGITHKERVIKANLT